MQLKRSGPAPSHEADGRVEFCPPPSNAVQEPHSVWRLSVTIQTKPFWSRRGLLASVLLVGLLPTASFGADKPKTINIDWATYNPVSMLLKEKGLLEKEFAKD